MTGPSSSHHPPPFNGRAPLDAPDGDGADLRGFEGRVIDGRYELREWIDEGNFGAVFRARQLMLGTPVRPVAVKLSRAAGLTPETARDRFADALLLARAASEIIDPSARGHLVPVYDAGVAREAGHRAYLVMEFVEGRSLAAEFQSYRAGVPPELLVRWASEICVALRGLHGLVPPLLHRDLKPDNVLVGKYDRSIRVVDFGLAGRLLDTGTIPGVTGTLRYMAPETSQGESFPASDLYSVGLLLYEGLTGRHPFGHLDPPAHLPEVLHGEWLYDAKRDCRVAPPSTLNNLVSPALDDLVLRCLDIRPSRRPASASELLDALETAVTLPRQRPSATAGSPAEKAARLRERGDERMDAGRPGLAAGHYHEAWKLVESHPDALPARRERAELARKTAEAYERAGNPFQATRFRRICDRLNGDGP
ncbi:MAG: serine/threonine-protein kinase [Spirillospora sp.]